MQLFLNPLFSIIKRTSVKEEEIEFFPNWYGRTEVRSLLFTAFGSRVLKWILEDGIQIPDLCARVLQLT